MTGQKTRISRVFRKKSSDASVNGSDGKRKRVSELLPILMTAANTLQRERTTVQQRGNGTGNPGSEEKQISGGDSQNRPDAADDKNAEKMRSPSGYRICPEGQIWQKRRNTESSSDVSPFFSFVYKIQRLRSVRAFTTACSRILVRLPRK